MVFRRPGANERLDVALELEDAHGDSAAARGRRELAILDVEPFAPGEGLAAIVPSPFDGDEARAICAILTVTPAPESGAPGAASHGRAFAECVADLAREEVLARPRANAVALAARGEPDLGAPRTSLLDPAKRRAALLAIAHATGATLAEDVALSGEEATVEAVATSVARASSAPGTPKNAPSLGWTVERAALLAVRDLMSREEPPPQAGVLLARRAGALARSLGTLFGVVDAASSVADFDRRLAIENHDLLEDGSPAVRARAHEWLAARGSAVPGYDPLDPAAKRRAALERAEAASASGRP
jgi:hypothetical protein